MQQQQKFMQQKQALRQRVSQNTGLVQQEVKSDTDVKANDTGVDEDVLDDEHKKNKNERVRLSFDQLLVGQVISKHENEYLYHLYLYSNAPLDDENKKVCSVYRLKPGDKTSLVRILYADLLDVGPQVLQVKVSQDAIHVIIEPVQFAESNADTTELLQATDRCEISPKSEDKTHLYLTTPRGLFINSITWG